jgi:hypothetical protein
LKVIISAIGRKPTKAAPTAIPAMASHAPLAELLEQPLGHLVGALVGPDLLAEQEHRRVAAHLLAQRLVERLAHGEHGHG